MTNDLELVIVEFDRSKQESFDTACRGTLSMPLGYEGSAGFVNEGTVTTKHCEDLKGILDPGCPSNVEIGLTEDFPLSIGKRDNVIPVEVAPFCVYPPDLPAAAVV